MQIRSYLVLKAVFFFYELRQSLTTYYLTMSKALS